MGLLERVAEKPKSQDKTQNHQHRDYEDEDLRGFTHVTHFLLFFILLLLQRLELGNSESDIGSAFLFNLAEVGLEAGSVRFSSFSHGVVVGWRGWRTESGIRGCISACWLVGLVWIGVPWF